MVTILKYESWFENTDSVTSLLFLLILGAIMVSLQLP